jgi:hypothetical protein
VYHAVLKSTACRVMDEHMRKRTRQGLLLLLGLALAGSAWYGMKVWLKPQPLWVYQPTGVAPEDISLAVDCLSSDGRWMVVRIVDRKVSSARRYEILDRHTGQVVTTLDTSRLFQEYNHGYIHCSQPFTLAKDCLWWFAHRMDGDDVVIQLKCLPFLTSQQEQIVHHWRFHAKQRGFIRCVETDALHVVFHLRTDLEPALHALNALTQDGLTLLTHYQTVWATTNYAEVWRVAQSGDNLHCQKQNHYFQNDMYDSLTSAHIDEQGIAYSFWSKLRADNVITGEALGQYPLPTLKFPSGWQYLCGNVLVYRRYFDFPSGDGSISCQADPNGFRHHPDATFYDYSYVFDKTTRQPVQWPPDMHRDCLQDDELLAASERPDQLLHVSKFNPGYYSFLCKDMRLCFMTRQGNTLHRDRTLEVKHVHRIAYSPDASQLYADRIRFRHEQFPWTLSLVANYPSLKKVLDLLPEHTGSMDVLSAETGKILFSIPNAYTHFDHSGLSSRTLAHQQLILLRVKSPNQFPMHGHALECWQTPFAIPSPWWARGVALAVFALYWVSWCRWKRRLVK